MASSPRPRGSPAPNKPRRKPKYNPAAGEVFGLLTVTGNVWTDGHSRYVAVRCFCGTTNPRYRVSYLYSGKRCSCGCAVGQARLYELDGEVHSLSGWAAKIGISLQAVRNRLAAGWPVERALREPYKVRRVGHE